MKTIACVDPGKPNTRMRAFQPRSETHKNTSSQFAKPPVGCNEQNSIYSRDIKATCKSMPAGQLRRSD